MEVEKSWVEKAREALEELRERGLAERVRGLKFQLAFGKAGEAWEVVRAHGLYMVQNPGDFPAFSISPRPGGGLWLGLGRAKKPCELSLQYLPLWPLSLRERRANLLQEALERGWVRSYLDEEYLQPCTGAWRAVATLAWAYGLGVRLRQKRSFGTCLRVVSPNLGMGLRLKMGEFQLEMDEEGVIHAKAGDYEATYYDLPSLRTLRADRKAYEETQELRKLEEVYRALGMRLPLKAVEELGKAKDDKRRLELLREIVPGLLSWVGGVGALLGG